MECGARVTKKSTRPASGTSEPCSHIPNTRCLGGRGATAVTGTFFLGPYRGGTTAPPMTIPSGYYRRCWTSLHVHMIPAQGLLSEH